MIFQFSEPLNKILHKKKILNGLDKILNEGLLKDIPFCSTVISVLRQSISWDTFIVYADVIDRLLPKDEKLYLFQ